MRLVVNEDSNFEAGLSHFSILRSLWVECVNESLAAIEPSRPAKANNSVWVQMVRIRHMRMHMLQWFMAMPMAVRA